MTGPRVLVALDPGVSRDLPLAAAASLAGEGPAEVTGLYVEDATLLRVARLAVAREVTAGAAPTAAGEAGVEEQFRIQAGRLRALLETAALRHRLPWRFTTARGDPVEELLRAAAAVDVLVLAHSRLAPLQAMAERVPVERLLAAGPHALLFVQEAWTTGCSVLAVGDSQVIASAGSLARAEGLAMRVAGIAGAPAGRTAARILHAARAAQARIVVLGAAQATGEPGLVPALLRLGDFSLLVAR